MVFTSEPSDPVLSREHAARFSSDAPFWVWGWGWGTPLTTSSSTQNVSYAYLGGMNVQAINNVVLEQP